MPRSALEEFVYRSDFLERQITSWKGHIALQDEHHKVCVARHDEWIVGFSCINFDNERGKLDALYILPEYQRRRLGYALLKDLLAKSDEHELTLEVVPNIPAISFYTHHGFELTGARPLEACPEIAPGKRLRQLTMTRQNPTAVSESQAS